MYFDKVACQNLILELCAICNGKGLSTDHNCIDCYAFNGAKSLGAAIIKDKSTVVAIAVT